MRELILAPVVILLLAASQCREIAASEVCEGCLILTPFIRNGSTALARDLSSVDPENYLGIKSHAGFITVNDEYDSNLFFWFFPHEAMETTPWIIWLQGGPGFSSLYGLFDLIGPLRIEDGKVQLRNLSWATDYSLLFIDNPVGAGFSFTTDDEGYPDNEDDLGEQLLEFLRQFLEIFPELRSAPLFLAGESYAGKYVPALGVQIHTYENESHPINLRGLVIGSGLIDPRSIMQYSQLCSALGLLEDDEIDDLRDLERITVLLIDEGRMVNASNKFNETIEFIKKHSGVSIYNFNKDPDSANNAPDFETFLNSPRVRESIGVGNATFDFNNQLVYKNMLPDIANSTKMFVEQLLEHYGVMCFHGQQDIIVAYSLAMNTYKSLNWSRRDDYLNAPRKRLRKSNGDIVAFKKSGGNFAEVLVRRAGHMVPGDQPEVAKFLLDSFINKYK